jgi:DNA-binding HxlR family transcriptional regulator
MLAGMELGHMTLAGRLADRDIWKADRCMIGATMGKLGTRSAMLLMREALYGTTRFDDFVTRVGVTEKVAAARLRELVGLGLLARRAYREPGSRTRHEYVLTESGAELTPVLLALWQWGDRHLAGDEGPALQLRHTDCDAPIQVDVRCADGHTLPFDEITVSLTGHRSSRTGGAAPTTRTGVAGPHKTTVDSVS